MASKTLSTAEFPAISYSSLVKRDAETLTTLRKTCETHGFLYLDLRGDETRDFLETNDLVMQATREYFDLPLDEKIKDRRNYAEGYEPCGLQSGAKDGSRDGFEALKALSDSFTEESRYERIPPFMLDRLDLFTRYNSGARQVLKTILCCLSDAYGLAADDRLEFAHSDSRPSLSNFAIARYPKQGGIAGDGVGIQKHTDIGTLTLVMTEQWGLQVIPPVENDGWRFVEPKLGHAVVNVGDTLRFLTRGRVRSAVHRVMPLGEHMTEDRYTVVYFLRACDDTVHIDADGQQTTAREWHDFKYDHLRESTSYQEAHGIITAGMEKDGRIIVT